MRSIEQSFYPADVTVPGVATPGPARGASCVRHLSLVPAPSSSTHLSLTRRGRLVVHGGAALLVAVAGVVGLLGFAGTAEAGDRARSVPVAYHVVMPGETLWRIAGEHAPGIDRRDTIARIVELNALPGENLDAGQLIALPLR